MSAAALIKIRPLMWRLFEGGVYFLDETKNFSNYDIAIFRT